MPKPTAKSAVVISIPQPASDNGHVLLEVPERLLPALQKYLANKGIPPATDVTFPRVESITEFDAWWAKQPW